MKSQSKILILLFVVLCALGAYTLGPADWSEGFMPLKKADLTALRDTAAENRAARAAAGKSQTAAAAKKVEKDTARQRILFIGDSMLEGLSKRLSDYVDANGHDMESVIWYSSSSKAWAECDTLEHFKNEYKPTFVIVCLGANELFVKDLSKRREYVQRVVSKIGNIPFVWIGPPNWKPDTGINAIVRETVGDVRFFDSSHLQLARKKDGAHPTTQAAATWTDQVATWMGSPKTAHPIRLDAPTKVAPSHKVIVLQPYQG